MAQPLARGFDNPPVDAACLFRALLGALARPGRIATPGRLPAAPAGLTDTAYAAALTLCDADMTLWLHPACATDAALEALRFHSGSPVVDDAETADFAIAPLAACAALAPRLKRGSPKYPDRSTTLIALCKTLGAGAGERLSGPGIEDEAHLDIGADGDAFWPALASANARFPLGVDVFLAAPGRIAAVPRSTRIGG